MLVLSRKEGERVVVGGRIVVTVVEVHGDRVRLAFDAPPEVPIHREEVFRRLGGHLPAWPPLRPDATAGESSFLSEFA
jgi:carbon storage regulator